MIPKIIHLTTKHKTISEDHRECFDRIQQLHPQWEINMYDDRDMEHIVKEHFPELWHKFNLFPRQIQRLDIFRFMLVDLYGGFYMDIDVHCCKPLDPLLEHTLVLGIEKVLLDFELNEPHHKYAQRIGNYIFGSTKQHPFLRDFIEASIEHFDKKVRIENDILETTGPGALTNFYHRNKSKYSNITLLQNDKALCPKGCSFQPACHFGDYALHLHQGSWRWENKNIST